MIFPIGRLIENTFADLMHFIARLDFLKHWILDHLLLDQVVELERSHLEHFDALPQLRR